ncbi:coiled-coil domain-containing protein 24 [Plectropomus leopardus]|uniref:coiled-coil domain-containing protein 24 n=1 Tax=Plectropomus leopardus TaxID=160734 RepID=UPI001C4ACBFC|nr:coiled-coil domain-containing protein 24 [Plectropomus leopardus]
MQAPDRNQLWCPGQSLWSLITEHAPDSELPKIHTALGHALIDMYTEVHTEADMWHKMWQASHQGNSGSRAGTPLPRQQVSPLADPPAVKELVRAEVKMLLQTLRERASSEGRDGEELLSRYKPETVDYALSYLDSCSNPGDTDNGSRPSSHCSNAEDEIEALRDKLNVTDLDQVVDRLRCVMTEECEALKRLVKHFKENFKQKCRSQCESDKSEPTLAELRELRGAVQMDLELYPSSLAAPASSSPPRPVKELKNRIRLSASQAICGENLQALNATSALRPNPPPPRCHSTPKPPPGAPPNKTSSSVKLINSSALSNTHGQHRSASTGPRKTQTPFCNRIATPVHVNSHFTISLSQSCSDPMIVKTVHDHSHSPEQDGSGLHHRTLTSSPTFEIKSQRNSPIQDTHLSSHRCIHSLSRNCDLSPQTERKPPHCGAGSYNSTEHSVSTTGKSKTQNGQQNSTCEGSLVSTTAQTDNDRRKSSSESFYSPVGFRKSNNGTDRTGHLEKEQQSHPASLRTQGQLFTSPKRPLESTTSQLKGVQETKTELEFINRFYQPVPPARVST